MPSTPQRARSRLAPLARATLAWVQVASVGGLALVGSLRAQELPDPTLPWPQTQPRQDPENPPLLPNPLNILLGGTDVHPRARRGDLQAPAFQPFPVLTPPGFGAYPGGQLAVPFRDPGMGGGGAPRQPRSANTWPRWLPGSPEGDEGFTPDVAIVAQNNDYVWLREPGDSAYVPLASWDRYRVVTAGTEVEVRGGGQYVLAFQRGAVARVLGRSRVRLERLDEEVAAIGFDELTRVVATAGERPVRARIGQAGEVEFLSTRVSMQRTRGLVHVDNLGPGDALFSSGDRQVDLLPGHRITLLPALPQDRPGGPLGLEGDVRTGRDGRVLRATGGPAGGAVAWSGARFDLPRDAVLRIDPLGGDAFPEGTQTPR